MKVFVEKWHYPQSSFDSYTQKRTRWRKQYRHNLDQLLVDEKHNNDQQYHFLLNEKRFNYFQFFIHFSSNTKFTRPELQKIINEKMLEVEPKTSGSTMLFYTIDSIYVNGEASQHVLAKTWTIFFNLAFVFIDNHTKELFSKRGRNIDKNRNINLIPRSYYTIAFLRDKLNRRNFHLLDIQNNNSTIINVQNWFYAALDDVNWWSDTLKSIYKDNNILQYYTSTKSEIEWNPLAMQTVEQSVDFFTKTLAKRVKEQVWIDKDLILISDLTTNEFFQENFSKRYNKFINGYIVPFTYSKSLDTFDSNWKRSEMNVLTALNHLVKTI